MDNKAQGALEYLLLIGGAVLIAAIVIVILTSMTGDQGTNKAVNEYNKRSNDLLHSIY